MQTGTSLLSQENSMNWWRKPNDIPWCCWHLFDWALWF